MMRALSHQISVCATAWPGGQQNTRDQPLAADALWTRREAGSEDVGGGDGFFFFFLEKVGDGQSYGSAICFVL